jgi:hypothetical protein
MSLDLVESVCVHGCIVRTGVESAKRSEALGAGGARETDSDTPTTTRPALLSRKAKHERVGGDQGGTRVVAPGGGGVKHEAYRRANAPLVSKF